VENFFLNLQGRPGNERTSVGSDVDAGPDDEVVSRSGTVFDIHPAVISSFVQAVRSEDGN
jgi:hypothetical protein